MINIFKKSFTFVLLLTFCFFAFACVKAEDEVVEITVSTEKKETIVIQKNSNIEEIINEENISITSSKKDNNSGYLIVEYGKYYKSSSEKDKLEWLVIDKNDDYSLLLSKNVLDCKNYNDAEGTVTWKDSTLREWLNETFISKAFDKNELSKFGKLNVFDGEFVVTGDRIGILSTSMCEHYFGKEGANKINKKIQAKATDFAISNGMEVDENKDLDTYKNASFFLADNGDDDDKAAWVGMYGHIYYEGQKAKLNTGDGVRPIICLRNDVFSNGVIDSINQNIYGETSNRGEVNFDENETQEYVEDDATSVDRNYTYTNESKEKLHATTIIEKEKNVIDLEEWKYGMTPIEWIYVSPNKQLISNSSPNMSTKFGYKQNTSSGEKGCYIPVFTRCETYGDDYEGRMYVYEDYTKIPIDEIKFGNKFEELMYGDNNVKELLKKRYEITEISDGVVMAGDVFVNVVYVSELDDIINNE